MLRVPLQCLVRKCRSILQTRQVLISFKSYWMRSMVFILGPSLRAYPNNPLEFSVWAASDSKSDRLLANSCWQYHMGERILNLKRRISVNLYTILTYLQPHFAT